MLCTIFQDVRQQHIAKGSNQVFEGLSGSSAFLMNATGIDKLVECASQQTLF
jgi:hypothetical protein